MLLCDLSVSSGYLCVQTALVVFRLVGTTRLAHLNSDHGLPKEGRLLHDGRLPFRAAVSGLYCPIVITVTPRSILLAFLLPVAALAQGITVNINATATVRTVDERVFGINAVIWDPEAGSNQTVSLLEAAGIRTIRIPGGSLSDEYRWRVNRSIDRNVPSQNNTWRWSSGFDKFANLITGLNSHAFVTVNYGSGTPEEAAAWVAYANAATTSNVLIGGDSLGYNWQDSGVWARLRAATALTADDDMNFLRLGRANPFGLKHWEIGNENYGAGWETDLQIKRHDPTTYATRARDYIAKMKAVDPTIKIGVVVVPSESDYANGYTRSVKNPRTGMSHTGWTPVMLTTLRELGVTPDMVIYHRYDQAPARDQPANPENDAVLLQKARTWPDDAATLRRLVNDYLGTAGAGVEIVVTEANSVYALPGKQTTSLVDGLYLADSIGNILQTEIGAFMWWDTRNGTDFANNNSASLYGWRNYGDYGILSTPANGGPASYYEPYPTYYAMKLLSKFARHGDTVIAATSNSSQLSVFAVKTIAGGVNLLAINKSPTSTLNASIEVSGFTPSASATTYFYGKTQDDAARPGGTGTTDLLSQVMNVTGTTFSASFGSYSMTVIQLTKMGSTPPPAPGTPNPPTPAPPTTPPSSGGGGGAPSLWFMGVLAALAGMRWARARR